MILSFVFYLLGFPFVFSLPVFLFLLFGISGPNRKQRKQQEIHTPFLQRCGSATVHKSILLCASKIKNFYFTHPLWKYWYYLLSHLPATFKCSPTSNFSYNQTYIIVNNVWLLRLFSCYDVLCTTANVDTQPCTFWNAIVAYLQSWSKFIILIVHPLPT